MADMKSTLAGMMGKGTLAPHYGKAKKKKKVAKVMGEFKAGALHSGSKTGPVVKDKKQAIAIALSEQAKVSGKKRKKPLGRGGINGKPDALPGSFSFRKN